MGLKEPGRTSTTSILLVASSWQRSESACAATGSSSLGRFLLGPGDKGVDEDAILHV